MLQTALLPSLTTVVLPQRLAVDVQIHGIHIRRLTNGREQVAASVEAYRSRGATTRRALIKHLLVRESNHRRGRPSRFIRGTAAELITLRKASRRKYVSFQVGIVQPGLIGSTAPAEHLAVLGATNTFIRCITNNSLIVYGSSEQA